MTGIDADLISVIVVVSGRVGDLVTLHEEYRAALRPVATQVEFIFVFDGQNIEQLERMQALARATPNVVVMSLTRRFGEAVATKVASQRARGARILTLPAYSQVAAGAVASLLAGLDHADLVVARREPRAGNWFETLRRRAFHRSLALVTKSHFSDLGCSARAMRRAVLDELHLYGEQQRFLPILAESRGFRVIELPVPQSPADRHAGIYGLHDYGRGGLDILTMLFLVRFARKPLRLFGLIGSLCGVAGALLLGWLAIDRLWFNEPLADRPLLLFATLLIVLGVHLLALGLLGELIIYTNAAQTRDYRVDRVVEHGSAPAGRSAVAAVGGSPVSADTLARRSSPS